MFRYRSRRPTLFWFVELKLWEQSGNKEQNVEHVLVHFVRREEWFQENTQRSIGSPEFTRIKYEMLLRGSNLWRRCSVEELEWRLWDVLLPARSSQMSKWNLHQTQLQGTNHDSWTVLPHLQGTKYGHEQQSGHVQGVLLRRGQKTSSGWFQMAPIFAAIRIW